MKRISRFTLTLLLLVAFANAQDAAPGSAAKPQTITVPGGTRILLAMRNTVNTRTGRTGDGVYLENTQPVAFDNRVVVPEGTSFQGRIVSVERAGKLKGRASLRISIDRMIYRNGYVVEFDSALRGSNGSPHQSREDKDGTIKAESSVMRDTILLGTGAVAGGAGGGLAGAILGGVAGNGMIGARAGAGVGALVGIISALAVRGQDVMLPEGTTVEIELQRPVELDVNRIPVGSPVNYTPPRQPMPESQRRERAEHRLPPLLPIPVWRF